MHMWFWFGEDLGTFLFPGFNVTTTWGFVSTCLGLAALAILYEGMKIVQIKLHQITLSPATNESQTSENSSLLSRISITPFTTRSHCASGYKWMLEVCHWSIHTTLGYLLMMAVMTYNAYITIALAVGACIGYWVFGPTLIELNLTNFYAKQKVKVCDKECADNIVHEERRPSVESVVAEQLVTEAVVDVHAPVNA